MSTALAASAKAAVEELTAFDHTPLHTCGTVTGNTYTPEYVSSRIIES
jgi:hypothetical protein